MLRIQNTSFLKAITGFLLGLLIAGGVYWFFLQDRETELIEYNMYPVIGKNEDNTIPDKYIGKLSLFILAGQSNMSGRGEMPAEPLPVIRESLSLEMIIDGITALSPWMHLRIRLIWYHGMAKHGIRWLQHLLRHC